MKVASLGVLVWVKLGAEARCSVELRDSSTSFSTLNKGLLLTLFDTGGQVLSGAQGPQHQLLHLKQGNILLAIYYTGGQVLSGAQGLQHQLLHINKGTLC